MITHLVFLLVLNLYFLPIFVKDLYFLYLYSDFLKQCTISLFLFAWRSDNSVFGFFKQFSVFVIFFSSISNISIAAFTFISNAFTSNPSKLFFILSSLISPSYVINFISIPSRFFISSAIIKLVSPRALFNMKFILIVLYGFKSFLSFKILLRLTFFYVVTMFFK